MIAVLVFGALAVICVLLGAIYLYLTRDPGARARPRRPLLAWRWRHNWQPRLAAEWDLAWMLPLAAAAVAQRLWAWHRKRLLPSRPAPRPHHHDQLPPDDAKTLAWIQAIKLPSPRAGWLRLSITSTVCRALVRQLEVQATRPWDDPTGTFSRTALNAALDGDQT